LKKYVKVIAVFLMIMALVATLPGCGKGPTVTINVYNWGEYIDEEVIDLFEKEYNINVNYETFATNEDMYVKLVSGAGKYDVIIPSDYMIQKLINEGMLLELDFENIPNFEYIDNRFKNLPYDPENKYTVPYFWGTLGIVYNKNMVDEPVDSWDILFDPKYAGNIIMLDSMRDTIGVALRKLGYSINSTSPDELNEAMELLMEQKPLVQAYYVDEIKDVMINGEAALALTWSGDAIDIYLEGVDYIGYAVPKEGTNLWFDCMAVPATSQHKKEAEMFINFMTDPEISYKNTSYVGYATCNKETLRRMQEENPDITEMASYWPGDEILDRCEVFNDLGEYQSLYNNVWTRLQAK